MLSRITGLGAFDFYKMKRPWLAVYDRLVDRRGYIVSIMDGKKVVETLYYSDLSDVRRDAAAVGFCSRWDRGTGDDPRMLEYYTMR